MDHHSHYRQKAFVYLSHAVTFAASLPGLEKMQYANQVLDLIYQNLQWSGVLEEEKSVKLEKQLLSCLSKTMNLTTKKISSSQKVFLEKIYPVAEKTFIETKSWNMEKWERVLQKTFFHSARTEGEWYTPKEMKEIAAVFMQCFRTVISDYSELSNVVLWEQVALFQFRLTEMEIKLTQLEKGMEDIQEGISVPHLLTNSPTKICEEHFLHRKSDIETVVQWVSNEHKMVMINGLGGIGKTALARSVYHSLKDQYEHAIWINYDGDLQKSLCSQLKFHMKKQDTGQRYQMIENFLTNHKSLLLVIDNLNKTTADDPTLSLLTSLECHIIVTSRQIQIDGFCTYSLGFLDEHDCVDIFYGYYGADLSHEQIKTVFELVRLAKCHTLMVELLARTARIIGYYDLNSYLLDIQGKGIGFSGLKLSTGHTVQEHTITEHLNRLFVFSSVTEEQKRILVNFSFMPNVRIPAEVKDWLGFDINSMEKLIRLGWIQRSESGYEMSDIVRQTIRLQNIKLSLEDFKKIAQNTIYPCLLEEVPYTEALVKLNIGDAYLKEYYGETSSGEASAIYLIVGLAHHEQGNYAVALERLEKAVKMAEMYWKCDELDLAYYYKSLAATQFFAGRCDEALEYYQKATEIIKEKLGKENFEITSVYNGIAVVCRKIGKYKEADKYDRLVLRIKKRILGEECIEFADSYESLGSKYIIYGDYKRALYFFNKERLLREKLIGCGHWDTLDNYRKIADAYIGLGKHEKGLRYLKKAIDTLKQQNRESHPKAVRFYNDISVIYRQTGQYDKALHFCKKALVIQEKTGCDQTDTASLYHNIAMTLQGKGEYKKALNCLKRSSGIYEKTIGIWNLDMADVYNSIGYLYSRLKEYESALEYYNKAAEIHKMVLSTTHPDLAVIYNNIGEIYLNMGKHKTALDYLNRALSIRIKNPGEMHPTTAAIYNNMGMVYGMLKEYEKAEEYFEKGVIILKKTTEERHPLRGVAFTNFAWLMISLGAERDLIVKCLKAASECNLDAELAEIVHTELKKYGG